MDVSQLVWCSAVFLLDCLRLQTGHSQQSVEFGLMPTSSFSLSLLHCCFLHFSVTELPVVPRDSASTVSRVT